MRGQLNEILDQTGDGGDSCNFTCTWAFFTGLWPSPRLTFTGQGCAHPVRHPFQKPWDNHKNFTVDQAVPWVAVAKPHCVRKFFAKHWLFAPNTERDHKGSTKYPWPHKVDGKWRLFDFADPIQPSFFGMMVLRGHVWPLYPLLPFCWAWCVLSILAHCFVYAKDPTNNDFKQLFIMCTFYKLEKLFCDLHPRGLVEASRIYFVERRALPEIHHAFIGYLKRRGLYERANKICKT